LFLGVYESKLRFFSPQGQLIPTPQERAEQEKQAKELAQQQVQEERQQKELAQQRVEELLARLKQLGVEPDTQ